MRVLILIMCFVALNVSAQDINAELKELSTPSNPAFNLLGISTNEVSRPTLLKPFVFNLGNSIGSGGSLISDVAIEASPFWWFTHPELTYEQYYRFDNSRSKFGDNVLQSLALSIATSDASPKIDSIDSRDLAIGLRFQLLKGRPSNEMRTTYLSRKHQGRLGEVVRLLQRDTENINDKAGLISKLGTAIESAVNTNEDFMDDKSTEDEKLEEKNKIRAYFDKKMKQLPDTAGNQQIQDFINEMETSLDNETIETLTEIRGMSRVGWLWEMASAYSGFLPDNRVDNIIANEWGYWTTVTYRMDAKPNKAFHDFIGMGRISGNAQFSNTYNIDLGGSWVVSSKNYSLSLEAIFRQYRTDISITATDGKVYDITETDNTMRLALAFQYRLTDNINLTASFGKDYDNSFNTGENIFSLINAIITLPEEQKVGM